MKLPVIGVSPGAAYGAAKRWLPERFAEAAARLAADIGGSVAVFGSAAEKPMCEEVARAAAGGRNFAGETDAAGIHRYDRGVPRVSDQRFGRDAYRLGAWAFRR